MHPRGYPALEPLFDSARGTFIEHLGEIASDHSAFARFGGQPPAPRFEQDWFPRLDLMAAYTMVRRVRPRLIAEIGSGHSTRVLARACSDLALECELISIDPAPRAALHELRLRHWPRRVEQLSEAEIVQLCGCDLLFIDSSHIAWPGSDVDRIFADLLPRLRRGTIVHFHDVFLPDPYPETWIWRGYTEQIALACLLQGRSYDIHFSSRFITQKMRNDLSQYRIDRYPLWPDTFESSLWLRKMDEPTAYCSNQKVSGL